MKKERRIMVGPVLLVFWQHAKRYPFLFAGTFIGVVGANVIGVIIPLFYKQFFDVAADSLSPESVPTLVGVLIWVLVLGGFSWILRRVGNISSVLLHSLVIIDLGRTAFASLLKHSYHFFTNNFTGSLVRRVSRLGRSFEIVADQTFYNLIPLVVSITGITYVLFLRNQILGFALLGWIAIFLFLQFFIVRWNQNYNLRLAEKDSQVTGALSDAVSNEASVRLFSGEAYEGEIINKVTGEQRKLMQLTWGTDEVVNAVQGGLMILIEFILMYASVVLFSQGVLTVGDFALVQAYLIGVFTQLWGVTGILRRFYASFADATEMVEIMQLPREVEDLVEAPALSVTNGDINFNDISFRFSGLTPVLEQFSLSIRGGERVALVGPSGAGKSTIIKLLLRLYDVEQGAITIDAQNIAEVMQESLRDAISLVPQDPILFHRTLMENIRYGKRDATDAEVIHAAKLAHCHEFIERLPEGYATYVGERGVKLSGGERQRIAIARAILKNAPILVLDEATSSLDSESESLIQDALDVLMRGKTVIVIAHRLSTIMRMDRIVVLEGGKVIDEGSHSDLITRDSLYKKLWDIQAGGFLAE